MVEVTPTLRWLKIVLDEIGLRLDDVIVMDLFPMLTNEWLDEHPDERDQVIPEMFELTLDFIREFKPPIILSCQCFPSFRHERWGSFDHYMIHELRSSMLSAKSQKVSGFHFEKHFIHCVQGFHPASLCYGEEDKKQRLDGILRQIVHSLFEPCAHWQNEHLEKSLDRKTQSIKTLIERLRQSAAEYDELRMRGHALGMSRNIEGLIPAEHWNNPTKALDWIGELLSSNTSEKSPL